MQASDEINYMQKKNELEKFIRILTRKIMRQLLSMKNSTKFYFLRKLIRNFNPYQLYFVPKF